MMSRNLVRSAPWFVRVKKGRRCNLRPFSRAGWLVTGLYAVAMAGLSLLLLVGEREPATLMLVAWAVVTTAMTIAFLVIAWRTSEAVEATDMKCRTGAISGKREERLGLAILSAAFIIAGALLGTLFEL
jgi:hypothetical protein